MASSSSAGPGRGRGRPPKASKATSSVADNEDAVDRLLSMIDDRAQSKESGQSHPSEQKRPSKEEAKRVAKEKKIEAKTANPKDEKRKDTEKSEKKRRHDDAEKASAKVPKGPYEWPPDPQEVRLTAAGAICDAQSRLQLSAYTDLRKWFQDEPSETKHPDPMKPGLRQEELSGPTAVSLEGLHNWSDDKGAGWKTMRKAVPGKHKAESRWFGANSWGSWRMAFLLARLQRQVWQAATELQAAPAPAQEEKPAEEPEKVLNGVEEWHMFSPKTIDSTKCLARTWNNGEGGQCQEAREDDLLCYKHQRMAVSKQGLLNGLVNGPIPEKRLRQFQEAAVKGLGLGRKIKAPAEETPKRKRMKPGSQRTFAIKEVKKKTKKAKLKHQQVKIKEAKEAKRTKDKVVGAATDSSQKVPKKSPRSDRNRTSARIQDPNSKEGTLPPQKPVKESDLFGRKPKERERPKKSEDKKPPPEIDQQPQGEVRSRRFLAKMSDLEQQRRNQNQNKWTSVGDAMDKALDQIDAETQHGPFKSLVNAQGCIPMSSMAKAVEVMKTTPVDHRLQFAVVLRKTMLHTPASTNEFMVQGGVAGLRHWLKDALPSQGQRTSRKQELVVLECLGLLHEIPVTLEVLQSTGIGSTLMAIRNYVAPAMADAGELVAKWMKKFSKELKRTKTGASTAATSSFAPPVAMPSSQSVETNAAPPMKAAAAIPRSGGQGAPAPPVPSPAPAVATQVPPAAPASAPASAPVYVPPAPKRVNFATRMLLRKRERQRNAQNEMEATLRELFRLHQVLEEDPPDAQTIDLRHLDID